MQIHVPQFGQKPFQVSSPVYNYWGIEQSVLRYCLKISKFVSLPVPKDIGEIQIQSKNRLLSLVNEIGERH